MSEDHKPSLEEETERIVAAGGFVFMDRVNGELAMSRALGDFQYKSNDNLSLDKQQVIAYPDVSIHERIDDDKLLLLACDGIWDVLENHEAISYLNDIILKEKIEETSEKMAESLIRLALNANSTDNLSAIVVKLNSSKK
jgi:serine/threonine protein phosphatase PrpC